MRPHRLELRLRVTLEQVRAVPARDEREAVRRERRLELRRRARELAAELDAFEARGPRLGEAGLELVSPPTSGRSSMVQVSGLMPRRTLMRRRSSSIARGARLVRGAHARVLRDLGDRHVPPGAARGGAALRIGLDDDHGRARCTARLRDGGLERRDVRDHLRVRAERARVRHEVDRRLGRERVLPAGCCASRPRSRAAAGGCSRSRGCRRARRGADARCATEVAISEFIMR